jgi:uncharacterized protein YciI
VSTAGSHHWIDLFHRANFLISSSGEYGMNTHTTKSAQVGNLTGRRAVLNRALAATAAFGAVATLSPVALAQDTASAKAGVFAVIYERGSAYENNKNLSEQAKIKEHIAYGQNLGRRFLAGGLLGTPTEDKVIGMVVFEAENIEAAKQWVSQDPGVQNRVLSANVRQWHVTRIKAYRGK